MADYTIQRNGKQCRVALAGDFTASLVPGLQAALKAELARNADEVVFDLGTTTMLDSSGIGLLIATHNSLASRRGRVQIVNVSSEVFRLLQSMRLAGRLNVRPRELEEAHHG